MINEKLIPAVQSGDHEKAAAIVRDDLKPLYEVHRKAIDEVVTSASSEDTKIAAEAESTVARSSWVLIAIGVGTSIVLTLAGFWVARGIARVLKQTATSMEAATQRDYTQDVTCTDGGEISHRFSPCSASPAVRSFRC